MNNFKTLETVALPSEMGKASGGPQQPQSPLLARIIELAGAVDHLRSSTRRAKEATDTIGLSTYEFGKLPGPPRVDISENVRCQLDENKSFLDILDSVVGAMNTEVDEVRNFITVLEAGAQK
jgi:hypothetical protein